MAVQEVIPELSPPEESRGGLPYWKKITVVIAGKIEIGKSTLINNLLRLSKYKEADTGMGTDPTTTEVTVYSERVDGIELKVVDVPGLGVQGQSDGKRRDIMAQLIAKTNKEADILLYCAAMLPGCQIDDTDIGILKLLQMEFGKDLFKHCILVNTFTNIIRTEAAIKQRAEGIAKHFQGALKRAGIPDIEVKAIQSKQVEGYKGILSIPAGFKEDDPNWRSTLLREMIKKVCENRYIPYRLDRNESRLSTDEEVGPTMYPESANTKQKVIKKKKRK